jgi:hypothetical protein
MWTRSSLSGTFALGGLAIRLAKGIRMCVLLWAWPEPQEQTGKLRLLAGGCDGQREQSLGVVPSRHMPRWTIRTQRDDHRLARAAVFCARPAPASYRASAARARFDNLAVDFALRRALA